jgi:pimeloyl-ACP methyl ester carboxylesterase
MEALHHADASQRSKSAKRSARDRLIATLPVNERRLSLNGVSTSVLEGGEGKPLVLLHGPGAYGAQWIDVIPRLVNEYRVIAPDLPGHGASGSFAGAPSAPQAAAWLDDLIECSCAQPPVLIGHTLGGAIAARYAADNGNRVSALVLVDSLGLSSFQPTPLFGAAVHAFFGDPTDQNHDGLWSQCVFDIEGVKRRLGERWELIKECNLAGVRVPENMAALNAWMEYFGIPEIPAATLARIKVPTTLIWGREDRATPLSVAELIHARYGWPLHVIENAADDPTIEQPEEFVKTLQRALEAMRQQR